MFVRHGLLRLGLSSQSPGNLEGARNDHPGPGRCVVSQTEERADSMFQHRVNGSLAHEVLYVRSAALGPRYSHQ